MNHQTTTNNSQHQSNAAQHQTPTSSEVSSWDESQIRAVIRHAGATGRSPEQFFSKKWKQVLCRRAS